MSEFNKYWYTVILVAALLIILFPLSIYGENKSGVDPQVISLPDGPGTISGLGESFSPKLNNGTAPYTIKIEVCPGVAGFQPEIAFTYDSGFGNGPLGLGWDINLPFIQRQTDKGLPDYDDDDIFIFSNSGELVPLEDNVFRLKIEGSFNRFIKTGDSWTVWDKNGVKHFYGETASSRITTDLGVFKWMPERSVDPNGNEIYYSYLHHGNDIYLQEIRYADFSVYRSVSFIYEDREDIIGDYRSRTEISTGKRLKQVIVKSEDRLVRRYDLEYDQAPGTVVSRLVRITRYGNDAASALPSMTFEYTAFDETQSASVYMANSPAVSFSSTDADLVDIDGDSLPDILYTPSSGHYFYLNQGNGQWKDTPAIPDASPGYRLSTNGILMADLDGSGFSDLVVQTSSTFGYYRNAGRPWEKTADWVSYSQQPTFSLENSNTRMVDLNNDGMIDALHSGTSYFIGYLNDDVSPWSEVQQYTNPGFPLSDKRVKLTDMNGDGMEDILYLGSSGNIFYLPNFGYGKFGEEGSGVVMTNAPSLPDSYIFDGSVMTMDVNADGLSDIVLIVSGSIVLWLNKGNKSFTDEIGISGMPSFSGGTPDLRAADMDGDGSRDILYVNPGNYRYVSLSPDEKPNLLKRIDNGLGMTTEIEYKSSTDYYLEAKNGDNPWSTTLSFPVNVVSKKTVTDKNSGQVYVIEYIYRDGYYDAEEREFRGFGSVDMVEYGDATAPTLKTWHIFDVGKVEESRKGMLLEQSTLEETGNMDPISGVFQHTIFTLDTKTLATGVNGEVVKYTYTSQQNDFIYEKTDTPKQLRIGFQHDDYGNETANLNYGIIQGDDFSIGDDEKLVETSYQYIIDADTWRVDRPLQITQTNLDGGFVADTRNSYDDNGNLVMQEKSVDGSRWIPVVRNIFDAYGNIINIKDANNHSRTIGYDTKFYTFPISETLDDLGLTMSATYDEDFGKVESFTDFNGHTSYFGYDVHGRLTSIVKPGDTVEHPTKVFEYHLSDPVSYIHAQSRETAGTNQTYDSYTYFDGLGRKLQVRSEGENGDWVVAEAVTFNLRTKEYRKWLPYFSASSAYNLPDDQKPFIEIHYDPIMRPIKEINPDDSFKTYNYLPLVKIEKDEEDNRFDSSHYDTPHTFESDGLERLIQVQENNAGSIYTTTYVYDGLDNIVKVTDDHGNVKTMSFDGLGRKTAMNDPDKGMMDYRYDDAGNLIQTTDNKGQVVDYTYDAANRILTESYNGLRVQYHYDDELPSDRPNLENTLGRLAYVEDEAGRVAFSYNSRGNVILKSRKTDGTDYVLGMTYDSMERMTRLVYPDGDFVNYRYNAMNQLESIPGYVDGIDYTASGQKSLFTYANGVESTYDYDIRQRLEFLDTISGAKQLQALTYAYDGVSNITAITDGRTNMTPESLTRQYEYDNLYRLTRCAAPTWYTAYGYDSIGNLTSKTSDVSDPKVNLGTLLYGEGTAGPHAVTTAGSYQYAYDGNGNLKTKTGYDFTFDHKDRMTAMNRTADGLHAEYRYDYEGNRVVKEVFSEDKTEKTVYIDKTAEVRGGQFILHVYAGDRRVARISKPLDINSLIAEPVVYEFDDFDSNRDGSLSIEEIKAKGDDPQSLELAEVRDALKIYKDNLTDTPEKISFAVIAQVVREFHMMPVEGEIEKQFYIPDHLGSSSIMTDAYGAVVEESVYYPYGMSRIRTGDFEADYGFTGKEQDDENELHYFGARYYDSMVGRFISVDPYYIEKDTFKNNHELINIKYKYTYSNNNPIRYIDPNGLTSTDSTGYILKILLDILGAPEQYPVIMMRQKYQEGHQFSGRGLEGQCGWFAQQITTTPVGMGNTLSSKRGYINNLRDEGQAFYYGEQEMKVGYTIITDESKKTGHVAVVTRVNDDGSIELSESNYKGDVRVTHGRVIKPDENGNYEYNGKNYSIQGVVKSEFKDEFKE